MDLGLPLFFWSNIGCMLVDLSGAMLFFGGVLGMARDIRYFVCDNRQWLLCFWQYHQ